LETALNYKLAEYLENFQYEFQPSQEEKIRDIVEVLSDAEDRIRASHEQDSAAANALTNLAALTGLVAIASGVVSSVKAPKLITTIRKFI
jgi:hypothetical protein